MEEIPIPIPQTNSTNTDMASTSKITPEDAPPQNKKRNKVLIILGIVFIIMIIFASIYVVFLTKKKATNNGENASTSAIPTETNPSNDMEEDTSKDTTRNNSITANEISNKLDKIISDQESDIRISMSETINESCLGNASYINIKSAGNTYAKLVSKFDPDTITSCPINLKEMYFETYWTDNTIYYRHYEDKNFEILEPDSRIEIAPELSEMFQSIMPSAETIDYINNEAQGGISFEGNIDESTRGVYKVLLNTSGDIYSIEYSFKDNANQLTEAGTIMISEPESPIQLPASTNIDSSEEPDYEGFAN